MQLAGAEVLDTVAARSLVVGKPEDEPNIYTKQGSKGKGMSVLSMCSFREIMERTTKYQASSMSYEEIREHMSEKLRNGNRRMLTETEAKVVFDQWVNSRSEEELDQQVVKSRIKIREEAGEI